MVSRTRPYPAKNATPPTTDGPPEGYEPSAEIPEPERREMERRVEFAATERLMFFSDAVVAIAVTLLALELPLPEVGPAREMLHDLAEHRNEFIAFLISFVVVASHWLLHYRLFRYIRRAPRGLVALNLLWLLFIVVTPFMTRLLNVGDVNILTFGLYAATQTCQFAVSSLIVLMVLRGRHVRDGTDLRQLRVNLLHTVPVGCAFGLSIPLYLVVHQAAFALWFLVPMGTGIWGRVAKARRARRA